MNTRSKNPDSNILFSLLIGVHLSALPLYAGMPISIIYFLATLSAWQIFIIRKNNKNPGNLVKLFIIAISLVVILYSYGHILGQQSGIALVTLMTLLKLFEVKNVRDCYIIIYSSFFIIASNFLHSQSIWLILYIFLVLIFLLSILIALSDRLNSTTLLARLKMSSRFILYAIPLMLVMFVLFPRIPGPLWGLPDDAFSSQTGLSEEMSPGSINRLISSSAIAFRVKFDGDIPEHKHRYWRGAVLSSYDGQTWRRSDAPKRSQHNIIYNNDDTKNFQYNIMLEPTNLKWLLSLEYPITDNNQYRFNREAMLLTKNKINNVFSYSVNSQTNAINKALFEQEDYKNRLLPANLNSKTVKLAKDLLGRSDYDHRRYISNILSYFSSNAFVYTLNPDLLGDNAMDDFLFNSRRGFCEHYASAFVYLMRAAGIPSRIVIGYQGGEMNPLDDYMIVRQSDAHAWAEVWLTDHWYRVDPTATVSPDRVEQGVLNAGLENNKLPLLLLSDNNFIKNASFLYDSFQNKWNHWVIGFNQEKQNDLLKFLGFKNATSSNLILLLVLFLTITGLVVAWLLLKHNAIEKDKVQHYYNIFCQKLKPYGIQRRLNEGPKDFENRILNELTLSDPNKKEMTFIFKAYRNLHYGNRYSSNLVTQYIKKIKTFKLHV